MKCGMCGFEGSLNKVISHAHTSCKEYTFREEIEGKEMKETSNKGIVIVYERKIYLDLLTHGVVPLSKHEGTYTEYLYEFNESTFELIDKIYEQNYAEGHI